MSSALCSLDGVALPYVFESLGQGLLFYGAVSVAGVAWAKTNW